MSGTTAPVTSSHKDGDDEADDSSTRQSVASLVTRFSQKKPAPIHAKTSPPNPSVKTPPAPPPKPSKKPEQLPDVKSAPELSSVTQDTSYNDNNNGTQLHPRRSVSDLAKTLGKDISIAAQTQWKKSQPHVSVIHAHSPPKTQLVSGERADLPLRSDDVERLDDKSSQHNREPSDISNRTFHSGIHDSPELASVTTELTKSLRILYNEEGEQGADRRNSSSGSNTNQASISVRFSTEDANSSNTHSVPPTALQNPPPAQATDERNSQQAHVSRDNFPTSTVRQGYMEPPSPPVFIPSPPETDAPPPYEPTGAVDVESCNSSARQPNVLSTGARTGSDVSQGLRLQSEQHQPHVSFASGPFDDNFVSSPPPVPQERRTSTGQDAVSFHAISGHNVAVNADQLEAKRVQTEVGNAYVFTATPLAPGQQIVLKMLAVDPLSRSNGMAFGMTACDPVNLVPSTLPDDADLLLDRSEYWVVIQDVCLNPEVGDEVRLCVTADGAVLYSRNGGRASTLMHVDYTIPLWAFFDISGHATRVKSISPSARRGSLRRGSSADQSHHPPPLSPVDVNKQVLDQGQGQGTDEGHQEECTVCFEKTIDTVLYTCGHMCMCHECAVAMKEGRDGLCPICRQTIVEVIKVYRT